MDHLPASQARRGRGAPAGPMQLAEKFKAAAPPGWAVPFDIIVRYGMLLTKRQWNRCRLLGKLSTRPISAAV